MCNEALCGFSHASYKNTLYLKAAPLHRGALCYTRWGTVYDNLPKLNLTLSAP